MNLEAEMSEAAPLSIKDWWTRVAALGCLITGKPNPTLHHIHSGSCAMHGFHRGAGQRGLSDWLVIPLTAELHSVGPEAIDGGIGVQTWESRYGQQVALMDHVCRETGINAWRLAGIERDPWS